MVSWSGCWFAARTREGISSEVARSIARDAELPCAGAVEEELYHQRRVVRGLASPLARLVRREDRRQVQRCIHSLADEAGRVVLPEPVAKGGGAAGTADRDCRA